MVVQYAECVGGSGASGMPNVLWGRGLSGRSSRGVVYTMGALWWATCAGAVAGLARNLGATSDVLRDASTFYTTWNQCR
eukprot:3408867-Lingulodinium_polyedra.AAC.1